MKYRFTAAIAAILLAFALAPPAGAQAQHPPVRSDSPQQPAIHDPLAAVVRVRAPDGRGASYGSGTLIAVGEMPGVKGQIGWVLTANHVIAEATQEPSVTFPDGFESGAPVVARDAGKDLALLRIWKPKAKPVPIAAAIPARGQALTIAGYGGQGNMLPQRGQFSHLTGNQRERCWLEVSGAQARSGDSGGPIFDADGNLAGCLWGASPGQTLGSHVEAIRAFLPQECRQYLPPCQGGSCRPQPRPPGQYVGNGPSGPNVSPQVPVPQPQTPIEPPPATPAQPSGDLAAVIGKLESIDQRLAELEARKCERGPAGPPGKDGAPGRDGKDGDRGPAGAPGQDGKSIDVDQLADQLEARLRGKLRVVVEPVKPTVH